jgi:kumamolisin
MSLVHRVYHFTGIQVMMVTLGLILLLGPLAGCGTPAPLQFTTLNLGIPAEAMNSPVVGTLPGNTELHVRITFKINSKVLNQMANQKIQPGQPSHLENFANRLGISDATYQKIKDFFSPAGIVLKLSKLRTHLAVDAKASTFARLLQTSFVIHKYNGRTFYAPNTPPKLPKFLADSIDAITGLDDYSTAPYHLSTLSPQSFSSLSAAHTKQQPAQDCSPNENTLLPRDVAHAYGYDQLWGRGLNGENMTVNLVEIDGAYQSDIQNYLDCIQFKGHFSVVNVDGSPSQALGESTLDIQMVAGLARSINIVVYQTDGNTNGDIWVNVNDELQQIIDNNTSNANAGSVVSISLGDAESGISTDDIRAIDSSLQQLTEAEHMTVFIASGDCGAFTSQVYGHLAVSFPASDPWAVSVGGTILSMDQNQNRAREIVWSDGSNPFQCKNRWGSGGGNSQVFGRPDWQNAPGVNNQYSQGRRQLPDVSAVAFALAVYFQGQWGSVGGTSAAAPIWATGLALVNEGTMQQVGKFAYCPLLFYRVANNSNGQHPYFDVTQGNNLYYPATPGWDFSTGLGTPNLADFYQAVVGTLGS